MRLCIVSAYIQGAVNMKDQPIAAVQVTTFDSSLVSCCGFQPSNLITNLETSIMTA